MNPPKKNHYEKYHRQRNTKSKANRQTDTNRRVSVQTDEKKKKVQTFSKNCCAVSGWKEMSTPAAGIIGRHLCTPGDRQTETKRNTNIQTNRQINKRQKKKKRHSKWEMEEVISRK